MKRPIVINTTFTAKEKYQLNGNDKNILGSLLTFMVTTEPTSTKTSYKVGENNINFQDLRLKRKKKARQRQPHPQVM